MTSSRRKIFTRVSLHKTGRFVRNAKTHYNVGGNEMSLNEQNSFCVVCTVKKQSATGPFERNRPRIDYEALKVSDVCLKRKLAIACRIWARIFLFSRMPV